VLPLPWAALAMIAQRKPNNDKGFEDLQWDSPEFGLMPAFFRRTPSKRPLR
jgi:hypothetical protein